MQQSTPQCSGAREGDSACCAEKFKCYVACTQGRLTGGRKLIVQAICDMANHFTSEELQRYLAARGHRMALTTVYRNLPGLEKAGIIRRTTFAEEKNRRAATYERVWGRPHHDHLLCEVCGRTVEFQYDAIEVLQEEIARRYGFRLTAHHLELVGVCAECRATPGDQRDAKGRVA